MKSIFVDSDVIIDYLYNRYPFSKGATKLLELCLLNKVKGFTSPLIIANVYYVLRKTTKHEEVIMKIKGLLNFLDIIEMNKDIVINALNSEFKDFEDALQNYSVLEHSDIGIIITRNIKDYKHSTLSIYEPETFISTIN